jgi:Ca2+:H+ antiporter
MWKAPIIAPVAGWLLLAGVALGFAGPYLLLVAVGLIACVMAAVHHAEVVAHRVGEPFGTLVLAIAVTVIEVALIVSLTLAGGPDASALARDTVFAAVMIILNGIVGLCLLAGGSRHHEQEFGLYGTSAALTTLAAIAVLTMVLPNYTETTPGPYYSPVQLGFIAVVSLVLYGTFVQVQTVRHRSYFLPAVDDVTVPAEPPTLRTTWMSGAFLLACLGAVVLLAKSLAPTIEGAVRSAGAPKAVVGIIIAAVVLLPEGLAALRAARANRLAGELEPRAGLGAREHRAHDPGDGDPVDRERMGARAGAGRKVDGAPAAVAVHRGDVPGHGAHHRAAGRGSPGALRRLPRHHRHPLTGTWMPFSVTTKSMGMSCGWGWMVSMRLASRASAMASGRGESAASVRSK